MDEQMRRKVCRLIAGIVVVDDDLDPAEDAFVDRMLDRFALPRAERDALFPIMDEAEAVAEVKSLPRDVQLEAFDLLVQAAAADKKYASEERTYLRAVGEAIGLSDEDIARRVDRALG
jgi:uncharacterized tellurite resistance protein B-like protein